MKEMDNVTKESNLSYANYLQTRSKLSYFYRKKILYPKLNKYIEGISLDIGCGIGDFLEFNNNTIGLDLNPELVDICLSKGLDAKVMEEDKIPFDDSSFDNIILDNVLEHIDKPDGILQEIKRVLKKEKNIIIGVPGKLGYSKDDDHKKFYNKKSLIDLMEKYKFQKIEIFGMPLNIGLLENIMRQYCVYGIFKNLKN